MHVPSQEIYFRENQMCTQELIFQTLTTLGTSKPQDEDKHNKKKHNTEN